MILRSIEIKKFRGFNNVGFSFGKNITAVAGQNGTQKTTLLGIISQPFSITDKANPMHSEKPLCGGNYRSLFSEKFKLSEQHDKAASHEWTLNFISESLSPITLVSIERNRQNKAIRFWRKGTKERGSGYIQIPVIYLSLSRLFPIGEDSKIVSSKSITLSDEEEAFFEKWHNKILCMPNVKLSEIDYLESSQKKTLGVNTDIYDWKMNSAGQDNIGKILLAILSFKRLKEKYPDNYIGGILAIDELDATLFTASQINLIDALSKFSSLFDIQIIFTTHSLTILEKMCELHNNPNRDNQNKVIYIKKSDANMVIEEDPEFIKIKNNIDITLRGEQEKGKITLITEDQEGRDFFYNIVGREYSRFKYLDIALGNANLIQLAQKKIPSFREPNSLIVLDGDVSCDKKSLKKILILKNVLLLPGGKAIERLIAEYLDGLSDADPLWGTIHVDYNRQVVFNNISLAEILVDREKAKKWYKEQSKYWGVHSNKVIKPWMKMNVEDVNSFKKKYQDIMKIY